MKYLRPSAITAALALSTTSSLALAAGFQIVEHSANGLGRSFAGEAAITENAAVLAHNPAAMSRFNQVSVSSVLSYVEPEVDIKGSVVVNNPLTGDPATPAMQANESDIAPSAVIPAFYLIAPVNKKLHTGVGIFTNFGLSTNYSSSFTALEHGDKTELKTININPNISYQLAKNFSLGLGISAIYADATLSTTTPMHWDYNPVTNGTINPALTLPGGTSLAYISGDSWDWNWNIGALWSPVKGTDLALSYRSGIDLKMDGKMRSFNPLFRGNALPGSLELNLPDIAELAINQQITRDLSIQASLYRMGWESFKELKVDVETIGQIHLKDENYKNSWKSSLGATYKYNHDWVLRVGIAYDESPVRDEYRTISIPDADRKWISAGASYQLSKDDSVDFGFAYIQGDRVEIHEEFSLQGVNLTTLNAELAKVDVYVFSAQYNIKI